MKQVDIIALFLSVAAAMPAWGAVPGLKNDGRLSIFSFHEQEYIDVVYRKGGKYDPEALARIAHLLRSRGDGAEHKIDERLIELVDHIQDRFGAETVEIVSGYRSPAYNRSLKIEGRGVGNESLHMQGMAADIHMDEVREGDVFDYIKKLGMGGAGLYPRYAFVHIDVGPPRTWSEAPPKERILVGTESNPNPAWTAVTDRDIYGRGETVAVVIANNGYKKEKLVKNVWVERFRRGEWAEHVKLAQKAQSASLSPGESAEYRWTIPEDQLFGKYRLVIFASRDFSIPPAYSNEFYIKRKA